MNETIVIYHGGCRDGFCAAWVYHKYLKQQIDNYIQELAKTGGPTFDLGRGPTYHPGYYGQDPPDVKDKDVVILDFCYPLEVMEEIHNTCKSFIWLDHHKTAQPVADKIFGWSDKVNGAFRLDKSGAGLAWDYFFPNEPRPWLVDYVEDRDLWKKAITNSDTINAYIACLEFDFKVWDEANNKKVQDIYEYGKIAEMKTEQYIREVCKNVYFVDIVYLNDKDAARYFRKIPTVNICQVDCSEVMAHLLVLYPSSPFSMYWFKRHDGMYQYGLRSIGDFDISSVAKLYGGGGHKNAAGFQLNYLLEELK